VPASSGRWLAHRIAVTRRRLRLSRATSLDPVPQGELLESGPPRPLADTTAEVDATFRTERRIAVGYFLVFLVATLLVPALTLVLEWWSEGRVIGGMSPVFLMTAVGLYVFFFLLALAAASLASTVEDRMLGEPQPEDDDEWDRA
jgi:hypothetical protein